MQVYVFDRKVLYSLTALLHYSGYRPQGENMTNEKTNEKVEMGIKKITIGRDVIEEGRCSSREVRILLNDFPYLVVCDSMQFYETDKIDNGDGTFTKPQGTSMTEKEIIRWYNQAEEIKHFEDKLIIKTKTYTFVVVGRC